MIIIINHRGKVAADRFKKLFKKEKEEEFCFCFFLSSSKIQSYK
jgi:hypothetical protein